LIQVVFTVIRKNKTTLFAFSARGIKKRIRQSNPYPGPTTRKPANSTAGIPWPIAIIGNKRNIPAKKKILDYFNL